MKTTIEIKNEKYSVILTIGDDGFVENSSSHSKELDIIIDKLDNRIQQNLSIIEKAESFIEEIKKISYLPDKGNGLPPPNTSSLLSVGGFGEDISAHPQSSKDGVAHPLKNKPAKTTAEKICPICNNPFTPTGNAQVFCSDGCKHEAKKSGIKAYPKKKAKAKHQASEKGAEHRTICNDEHQTSNINPKKDYSDLDKTLAEIEAKRKQPVNL